MYKHKQETAPIVTDQSKLYQPDRLPDPSKGTAKSMFPVFGAAEALMLGILRPIFGPMGVTVVDQHSEDIDTPLIIARSSRAQGADANIPDDSRFIRSTRMAVSVIMVGPNADSHCAQLMEAVQHALFNAWWEQTTISGVGCISAIDNFSEPVRVSDFQTATNIVQYASLPKGHVRYEQNFNIILRPDDKHHNPYIQGSHLKGE